MNTPAEPLKIHVDDSREVSALWIEPAEAIACCVLAHGAGAGMTHPFMERLAQSLAARRIATLRYQFPYMEAGSRRPDVPAVAHRAVRAAVAAAAERAPGLPLVAGGKSFGARMTSQAQAREPLPGVRGLVFFGFPLHPDGRPSTERGDHLRDVQCPMLFLQGDRDTLADLGLVRTLCDGLGDQATLDVIAHADHAFHVLARSGTNDDAVLARLADATQAWCSRLRG